MEIDLKITLSIDDLKDFCDALGWNKDNPLTKQQFFKEAIGKYVKQTIKGRRAYELELLKRAEIQDGIGQIDSEIETITSA